MKPERIAQVIGKMDSGGVESFIMSYYRNIDRNKIQFDFIIDEDSTMFYKEEIEKLGGKIIIVPKYQKILKYIRELRKIFRESNYKIVHTHMNALNVFPLYAAKKENVKIRISHSHSTTNKDEFLRNILKNVLKIFSKKYPTHYCACSQFAGQWLFGKKDFTIIRNAIDIEKFNYNKEVRDKIRKELKLENKLVIGHAGRFMQQKNHKFIIEIFHKYHEYNENSVLLLVGEGKLENTIKEQVKMLGLENNIIFLGARKDVNEIMQAMDIFVFPSLYEGLGIALVEAQTAGLKCIASNYVPEEAILTQNVVSLELDEKQWVDILKNMKISERKTQVEKIRNSGYEIKIESKKLEKYYLDLLKDNKEKAK